ncbi:MAG: ligD 1 [Firmicutes bacterium]|nr:ligD 1 [Bacillota bacterium]
MVLQYPELSALASTLKSKHTEIILDGEIVAFNADGLPSFSLLQHRMGLKENLVDKRMHVIPINYIIFDLLQLDSDSLLEKPYYERRAILEGLALEGPYWQTPAFKTGEGTTILAASRQLGLEGIIVKRFDSIYQPGKRSNAWLKIKNQLRQELVIGGWIPGQGTRKNQIGALLLGYYEHLPQAELEIGNPQHLMYAGKVGTGFTQSMLIKLVGLLVPLTRKSTPFANTPDIKNARFVEPQLVGEFEFTEWTPNHTLRHPVFKGLRTDKDPLQVIREE